LEEETDGKISLSFYASTKKDNTLEKDAEHEGKEERDAEKDAVQLSKKAKNINTNLFME
jgi:hypothetical protein